MYCFYLTHCFQYQSQFVLTDNITGRDQSKMSKISHNWPWMLRINMLDTYYVAWWKENIKWLLINWWPPIPPISAKRTNTSKQRWSTIPPISTKHTITCQQWWPTIPPISAKRAKTSKQRWSTIQPMSTKWTIFTELAEHKMTTAYDVGHPGYGLVQAHTCDGVTSINGIPTLISW